MVQTSRRDFFRAAGSAALVFAMPPWAKAQEWRQRSFRLDDATVSSSDTLLDEITEALLTEFPEDATGLGIDTGARAELKSRLTDQSLAGVTLQAESCAARLQRLRNVDMSQLQGMAAVNHAVALESHELDNAGYAFLNLFSGQPYVVSQMTGAFSWIPVFLDTQHQIETAADADAYLARLEAYAGQLNGETERILADGAAGVIPPDFILAKTLEQMNGVRSKPVADWILVSSLTRRAAEKGLGGDYGVVAQKIVENSIAPALERQIAALEALKPKATPDAGVWKLPQGETFYAWALKNGTTTELSPDDVHKVGLEQAAELSDEMDELLRRQGLTKGTVSERVAALAKESQQQFANNDLGRAKLITYLNGLLDEFRPKLPDLFRTLNEAPVEVRRVPPEVEAGSPLGMMVDGSVDGVRPAIYYINLQDTGMWPKFQLPTVTYHEALPGHVWQFTFSHKLPLIRTLLGFNAYIEGYALYAEQLATELGVYDDNPLGRLGYLSAMQLRACRLVVDTGLHAKRWSREQAIAWLQERTGDDPMATTSEIDRYIVTPGQATGYKVGHNEINRLRVKAKQALGERYDLRDFNDAILLSGSVPLTLLERIVDDYVASRGKIPD